jgi:hypothetical protein
MISSDAIYQFQVADIYAQHGAWIWGLETERARDYVFFPALHLLSAEISSVSGFALYQVCRFLPILFSIAVVIIVFETYALIVSDRVAIVGSFLFSICYKYNWFDGSYIQESLAIVFFAIALYSVARAMIRKERSGAFIFFLATLLLVMTHFLTSVLLLITVGLCWGVLLVLKRIPRASLRIGLLQLATVAVAFTGWVVFVAVVMISRGLRYGVQYSSAFMRVLALQVEPSGALDVTGIHITLGETVIVYFGFLIVGVIGFIGMVHAMRAIQGVSSSEASMGRIVIFCTVALAFGVLGLVAFLFSTPDIPAMQYRLIPFVYLFWSPAFAVGVWYVAKHLRWGPPKGIPMPNRRIVLASLCIMLVLPAASTWLLMPSYLQGEARLDDAEVAALSFWLRDYRSESAFLVGDTIMTQATAGMARVPSTHGRVGFNPPMPTYDQLLAGTLYYGSNMTSQLIPRLTHFQNTELAHRPMYLLVNEVYLSHKYYLLTYFFDSIPPPSEQDVSSSFSAINALPTLNRVYCNPSLSLYATH